ncbi:MAG: hypothetical protein IKO01_07120 [Kiritimatiellae bacterium]|nr:hypothetical protein [Kiritimatiellia bacterium]
MTSSGSRIFLATALLALCIVPASPAAAPAFRGRDILRRPDMCNVDVIDTVSWYANESVRLSIEPWRCGERIPIPGDATALWIVADEGGTNWIVRYAAAVTSTNLLFELAPGEGALPSGHDYSGFVDLMRGTNVLGVVDRFEVACITSAYGTSAISPAAGTWEGIAAAVTSNAAAIGELRAATNAVNQAALDAIDERIDSLWAECKGGWRWPDYFTIDAVTAGASDGAFTNAFSSTNTEHNVVIGSGVQSIYKGWRFDTTILRTRDFGVGIVFSDDASGDSSLLPLDYSGGNVRFPDDSDFDALDRLDDAAMHAAIDRPVTATLGTRVLITNLVWNGSAQRRTSSWNIFISPAPGSLLADLWDHVLATASNRAAAPWDKALRVWPSGTGDAHDTQAHPPVAWNTKFFAYGLADFSAVSYWAEGANAPGGPGWPSGTYRPVTMVTPRHGIVADHWKPATGSNVLWLGRSGTIITNKVKAYANLRGDLTVARLDHPVDTNEITPAALFRQNLGVAPYLCGDSNNVPGFYRAGNDGTWGVPVLPFNAAEYSGLAWWRPGCLVRGNPELHEEFFDNIQDNSLPQRKVTAMGGDSGSPTFVLVPGCAPPVLLGCYHYSTVTNRNYAYGGGPIPYAEEVNDAIAAWGDPERAAAIDFGALGYPNYNTNNLPPGP